MTNLKPFLPLSRLNTFSKVIYPRFSPAGQKLAKAIIKEVPRVQQTYREVIRQLGPGIRVPKPAEVPGLRIFCQIVADADGLKPPSFDGLVVRAEDHAKQGTLSLLDANGIFRTLSLEEAFALHLNGVPSLITGSNNIFATAQANALGFKNVMELENMIHHYLALDATQWLTEANLVPILEKNIINELVLAPANALANEAGVGAVGVTHSYGNFPKMAALSAYNARAVAASKVLALAPLSSDMGLQVMLECKQGFRGEIAIVRPAIDPLEEGLGVKQALWGDNFLFDCNVTDRRLRMSKHQLIDVATALKKVLSQENLDLAQFTEKNHATRFSRLNVFTLADGDVEVTVNTEPRSQAEFLQDFDVKTAEAKTALKNLLDNQNQQLEAIIEAKGSSSEETFAIARGIAEVQAQLDEATPETLPDVLQALKPKVTTNIQRLQAYVAGIIQQPDTIGAGSDLAQTLQQLDRNMTTLNQRAEQAQTAVEDLSGEAYWPEEEPAEPIEPPETGLQ